MPPTTQLSGPWKGVKDTAEPFDDSANFLQNATNTYIQDPMNGSGAYQRPGCNRNIADSIVGSTRGSNLFTCAPSYSSPLNFQFRNGKIYRSYGAGVGIGWTDVTPPNIKLYVTANAGNNKVFCAFLNDSLIVNSGGDVPWVGTNLTATPITGTKIDFLPAAVLLSRGTTDTAIATAAFVSDAATALTSIAAVPAGVALPAGTIPLNTWGVFRVVKNSSNVTVVTAGAANFTTGYATEVLAIAAVPAVSGTNFNIGYFTVQTKVGFAFVDGTDALAGGASGNVANATNYYAGASPPWQAYGAPKIYTGAVFLIVLVSSVAGVLVYDHTTITWSEPNQPLVGYEQTNYANFWTLTQTGTTPIYALEATNSALYYSRQLSWGALTGAPGVNFRNTATHDTISINIGCVACATTAVFGRYIYFCDQVGRPWRFAEGGTPEPIWLGMRAAYNTQTLTGNVITNTIEFQAWAVVEPNLNMYLAAPFAPFSLGLSPTTIYAFDAYTGSYAGQWTIGGGIGMDAGALQVTGTGSLALVMQQSAASNVEYVWQLGVIPDMQGRGALWADNAVAFNPSVQTNRMGYSVSTNYNVTEIRGLTSDVSAVDMTVLTPFANTDIGSVTAPVSADGVFRQVWGTGTLIGRGVQCTASQSGASIPTTQWVIYGVEVDMTSSRAVAGDP